MIKDNKIKLLQWNLFQFLYLLFFSAIVWFLWNWEFSRNFLDIVDLKIFYFLNGFIESSKTSQIFWALLNSRLADLIPAILIFILLLSYIKDTNIQITLERILLIIFFISLAALVIVIFKSLIFYDIDRLSPSLVIDTSVKLRDKVPWAYPKDESQASFPGDHATVLLLCVLFFKYFSTKKMTYLSICILLFFMMPRLVSGAHWFTDIIIGSTIITSTFYAFFVKTPLVKKIIEKVIYHIKLSKYFIK